MEKNMENENGDVVLEKRELLAALKFGADAMVKVNFPLSPSTMIPFCCGFFNPCLGFVWDVRRKGWGICSLMRIWMP